MELDQAAEGTYATGENAYERNFVVHSTGSWDRVTTQPVKDFTITAVYPNGTNGTSSTLLTTVPSTTNMFTSSSAVSDNSKFFLPWETIKFEYIKLSAGETWQQWTHLNGGRLICGRMCLPEDGKTAFLFTAGIRLVRCLAKSQLTDTRHKKCRWRLESGNLPMHLWFGYAESLLSPTCKGGLSCDVVLGNDYDRSLGDNDKLKVAIPRGTRCVFLDSVNLGTRQMNYVIKSGTITGEHNNNQFNVVFNMGHGNDPKFSGITTVVVEGGVFTDLAIGHDKDRNDPTVTDTTMVQGRLYMKGGHVRKSIWGAGNRADGVGARRMVFTGGRIDGWIAGGCNGTDPNYGGIVQGDIGIYFGGHTVLQHTADDPEYWYSRGGNLYGAGSGYQKEHATIGKVNNSYIVVADSAYISRNVYGGGNRGFCNEGANVQILGGTVAGKVFGGGYGEGTSMTGDVHVIIGSQAASQPHADIPLVHGNVYGGGFNGIVNAPDKTLKITTHNGRLEKSVFGGGFGLSALTTANPEVHILGTTHVEGNVYGGGNMGRVEGNTRVVVGD